MICYIADAVLAGGIRRAALISLFSAGDDEMISAKTGMAPRRMIEPAVAKNVYGEVITSSPGPTPEAISAISKASVPDETPTAYWVWQ